jgi:hypothetical protein
VRLWWDLVEVYIVRNAMDGERRVRQALLPALRLLWKYFFRTVGSFLLSGLVGFCALALCLFFWKQFIPAHQVWLACILAQLGLFLLLASRFWQRGIEAALVMSADPPIVATEEAGEEIDAIEEEAVPISAGAGVLPGMSDPTLRDLVQKLRNEPWANPDAAPAAPSRPSLAPITGVDSPKVDDPQVSIFDRHVTKFPLGGVDPAGHAEKPVEKAPDDPERPPRGGLPIP